MVLNRCASRGRLQRSKEQIPLGFESVVGVREQPGHQPVVVTELQQLHLGVFQHLKCRAGILRAVVDHRRRRAGHNQVRRVVGDRCLQQVRGNLRRHRGEIAAHQLRNFRGILGEQFRGFCRFPGVLQDLLEVSDEVGLIQPFVLVRTDDRGRHLLQVPPPDFAGMVIDLGGVHPSGGLHQNVIPIALEGNVELHHHHGECVVLQRAGEPLSAAPNSAIRPAR